ncbi:MAG: ABC transporter permease [Lachnospiraceae bacterium]|nr:ABC transporter permease [Candidatus Merdinaster equi]
MRFSDMLSMSVSNLWKRKLRTVLTILGVVIGTASIVVMISIGLGLSQAVLQQFEEYGGMTTIRAYPNYGGGNDDPLAGFFSEEQIDEFAQIEHVETASPVLRLETKAFSGKYEAYISLIGMKLDAIKNMDIELGEGSMMEEGDPLKLIYGNIVLTRFSNPKSSDSYWGSGKLPDVDLMNNDIRYVLDMNAWYEYTGDTTGKVSKPKRYVIPTAGVIAGGPEDYSEQAYNVYCDIEALKETMHKVFKGKVIAGQPTTKNGKPYSKLYYQEAYINVDDMNHVVDVQKIITDKGFQADSNMQWVKQAQEEYGFIEAVLGGIGAVAMLIAAISIANTMMMSIYERTKEIGIMKVLGCNMHNIQTMFLIEAGFIGFIGGILGAGLSYVASMIINALSAGGSFMGVSTGMSYIPIWLALLSVVFSVVVSTVAGFFPSLRAMRLSPLAAIRND